MTMGLPTLFHFQQDRPTPPSPPFRLQRDRQGGNYYYFLLSFSLLLSFPSLFVFFCHSRVGGNPVKQNYKDKIKKQKIIFI